MKKLLVILVLLIVMVVLVVALLPTRKASPALTFPDGTIVRVVGATYGTNHLHGPILYRMVMHSPAFVRNALQSTLARYPNWQQYHTPTPQLVLWVDAQNVPTPSPTNPIRFYGTALGDESNRISGSVTAFFPAAATTRVLDNIEFEVFPRRSKTLSLNFFSTWPSSESNLGNLRFDNPLAQEFPQWKPEPLPSRKTNGDVEFSLVWVETGLSEPNVLLAEANHGIALQGVFKPRNGQTYTVLETRLHMLTNSDEAWKVGTTEISDATGNQLTNLSVETTGWPADSHASISASLWPGEDAWKFKFLLRQSAGFSSNEIFVIHDVPLGAVGTTNLLGWNTNLPVSNWSSKFQGITITLDYVAHRRPFNVLDPDSLGGTELQFTTSVLPRGTYLDLLWCTVDSTNYTQLGFFSDDGTRRSINFPSIPAAATKADFAFAIHQARSIEFIVHPEIPTHSMPGK